MSDRSPPCELSAIKARVQDVDPRTAGLIASVPRDDPPTNSDPPRAANTIQGRYGPIPVAHPIFSAVDCKSCQVHREFEQQTNAFIATKPELVERDNVTTREDDAAEHVDAEESDRVAAALLFLALRVGILVRIKDLSNRLIHLQLRTSSK
jgi:hypothetical protein